MPIPLRGRPMILFDTPFLSKSVFVSLTVGWLQHFQDRLGHRLNSFFLTTVFFPDLSYVHS